MALINIFGIFMKIVYLCYFGLIANIQEGMFITLGHAWTYQGFVSTESVKLILLFRIFIQIVSIYSTGTKKL